MTATDWYAFHTIVDPIDTQEALQAALSNPEQAWYARRRIGALAATGALTAAFNPLLHPRGRDGKFIEKFGWVRWLGKDGKWKNGWVKDIDPATGALTVQQPATVGGQTVEFPNAKTLYAKPKPKARIALPNPLTGENQANWKKVGGQGGSNPGGMYEIDGSFADQNANLSHRSGLFAMTRQLRQQGTNASTPTLTQDAPFPDEANVAVVPSIDGLPGQYDVLQKMGGKWYRTPASGAITTDDLLKPELEVSPIAAFGEPGSKRREEIVANLGTHAVTRSSQFDVEDVAQAVQQNASPLPKVGDRYYVKTMNIPERARNEALANELYELLGVPVPDVAVGADGKTISSKVVGNTVSFDPNNPAHVKAVQEGFIADAFLSNWDVIGLDFDNVQIDEDGRAWRIDAGGALAYRAQGKPKGAAFGEFVGEMESLRNPGLNPTAAKVFGSMSKVDMVDQGKRLQAVTPDDIHILAEAHGLPEYANTLIARRKNVLDQLGIVDPPPVAPVTPPAPEPLDLNPAQAVSQMGDGPKVAVNNYKVAFDALPKTAATNWTWDATDVKNAVWALNDGDLYEFIGDFEKTPDGAQMIARNLLTGKAERISLYNGTSQYLTGVHTGNPAAVEKLVDEFTVARALAISDIVDLSAGDSLPDIMADPSKYTDVDALRHYQVGMPTFSHLMASRDAGGLGPTGPEGAQEWPLRNSDGTLWEITALADDGVKIRARDGSGDETTLTPVQFAMAGPWFRPGNDTTAALWQSKYDTPDPEPPDPDVKAQIDKGLADALNPDYDDTPSTAGPTFASEDELSKPTNTWYNPHTDTVENVDVAPSDYDYATDLGLKTTDPDLEALLNEEQAIADQIHAEKMSQGEAAGPGNNVKVVDNVVAGLGPGTPLLSTEMSAADIEQMKTDLIGQSVVVLPIAAHDNPDWTPSNMGVGNGLGTITDIQTTNQYQMGKPVQVPRLLVKYPNGKGVYVWGGEYSKFPKVVIPVETAPTAQQVVFKQNNDIFINGEKVGTWYKPYKNPAGLDYPDYYSYNAVIDGSHSLTGKPTPLAAHKANDLKLGASNMVVPIVPKPTKPKSTKVHATEDEIKALNTSLASIQEQIKLTEAELATSLTTPEPGVGVPLADGTIPSKGDWVFSTKDGQWAQVKQTELKFGAKHKQDPANFVRVEITQPDGTKKSTLRSRNTLVSGAGPGSPTPFVMSTKAKQTNQGTWYGPGTDVIVTGGPFPSTMTVLDTTVDGKVKMLDADGVQHWVDGSKVASISGSTYPAVHTVGGEKPDVDALNAQLAALNDEHTKLATTIANTTLSKPKPKKEIGTPFPGPAGMKITQSKGLAEAREAKGLKNMKDGYVPTPGMIIRHNDGTQYVVVEMGADWTSHKNSVRVVEVGQSMWDAKWRAVSTMVVDHNAMLTDGSGDPLPIVSNVVGVDGLLVKSGMLLRKDLTVGYYTDPEPGQPSMYRKKEISRWYVVNEYGELLNIDGTPAPMSAIQPGQPVHRVGWIDTEHVGGKTLTVSVQQHHVEQVGKVQYASIHEPGEAAAIPVAKHAVTSTATATQSDGTTLTVGQKVTVGGDTTTIIDISGDDVQIQTVPGATQWINKHYVTPVSQAPTPTPVAPTPTVAPTPEPTVPTSSVDTPTTPELPLFTGKDPAGNELPHPATTTSKDAVPSYQPTNAVPTLDVVGVPKAKSVTGAINEAIATTKSNQKNGEAKWVGRYALADGDTIEDMLVRTQTVKDAQGTEYVEVSFRVEKTPAKKNFSTFITSSTNETGDWDWNGRNAKNMVPGDQIAVRIASGGGVTPKGALRPEGKPGEVPKMPNATVVAPPILIGKNQAGTLDVWRTQVMTANGDIGFIDLEDRNGVDTVMVAGWDPTKPRLTTGTKSLNPNAKADGWKLSATQMEWPRATTAFDTKELNADGSKKLPTSTFHTAKSYSLGSGYVIERDFNGAHIRYTTSATQNSLDGHTIIRVRADDPDAQQKIAQAMELVGVSREAQQPPTREAIMQLAADKIYEQFNPVYTRGMKANDMQTALSAIDAAVGKELGRPATIDDITMRVTPDGRVQFFVSEDISRAIVKRNKVKTYTHDFMASGWEVMLEEMIDGDQIGLMSTTERWQHGLMYVGMSSAGDHPKDAADNMFLRMANNVETGKEQVQIDPVAMHRHLDYYYRQGDSFGQRDSDQLNWLNNPKYGGSNELMVQRRLEANVLGRVYLGSHKRKDIISKLKAKGITTAPNGMPLEEFFVATGSPPPPFAPPNFGDEIPLSSLPDTLPSATVPLAVV